MPQLVLKRGPRYIEIKDKEHHKTLVIKTMQPGGQGGHSQWHQQTRQSRVFMAISRDARTRACSGTCTRSLASSRGTRFERVTDKESRTIPQPWLKALCEARPCSSRAGLRSYRPYATQGHPSDKKEKVRSCCVAKQNWSNLPVLPSPDTSTRGGGRGGAEQLLSAYGDI